jgi:hypothetical protein
MVREDERIERGIMKDGSDLGPILRRDPSHDLVWAKEDFANVRTPLRITYVRFPTWRRRAHKGQLNAADGKTLAQANRALRPLVLDSGEQKEPSGP